jgi:hypothetical protein
MHEHLGTADVKLESCAAIDRESAYSRYGDFVALLRTCR